MSRRRHFVLSKGHLSFCIHHVDDRLDSDARTAKCKIGILTLLSASFRCSRLRLGQNRAAPQGPRSAAPARLAGSGEGRSFCPSPTSRLSIPSAKGMPFMSPLAISRRKISKQFFRYGTTQTLGDSIIMPQIGSIGHRNKGDDCRFGPALRDACFAIDLLPRGSFWRAGTSPRRLSYNMRQPSARMRSTTRSCRG